MFVSIMIATSTQSCLEYIEFDISVLPVVINTVFKGVSIIFRLHVFVII